MPRLVPLLIVTLVLLAGCTGTPGTTPTDAGTDAAPVASPTNTTAATSPMDTPSTTSPTGTPSTSSTPTASVPNGTLAPGVTSDGIENVSTLLAAHTGALREQGFDLMTERTVTTENQTYATERQFIVASNGRRVRADAMSDYSGTRTTRQSWLNASMTRMLTRVEADGETTYRIPPIGAAGEQARDRYLSQLAQSRQVKQLLRGGDFEVTGVTEREQTRLYTLVGTDFSSAGSYGEREVHLYVSPDGVIHTLKATGETADGDRFTVGYDVRRLGVTSVDRPDWVSSAPAPVDTRPTVGFENCSKPYLVLENPGPEAVPEGTVVTATLNGTEYQVTLDMKVPPGDHRALYLDASGALQTGGVTDVPTTRRAMPSETHFTVSTAEGMLLASGGIGFGCESAEGSAGS